MAPSTCCFCAHLNPARAKFCNECASPLHLKPCRHCDAVNARDEQVCYRCGKALPAALATPETSPERIVAQADETLAELKRELIATPAPDAVVSRESIRDVVSEESAEVSAESDVRASDQVASAGESVADDGAALALGATGEQSAPATDLSQQAFSLPIPVLEEEIAREQRLQQPSPGDDRRAERDDLPEPPAATEPLPTFHETPMAVPPEDRQWRPERRSRSVALVIAVALVGLPVAVYVMQNPAQLDEWFGRSTAPSLAEPTTPAAPPAMPTDAAPVLTPATSTAVDSATAALPTADTQPPALPPADTQPPALPPADTQPPALPPADTLPPSLPSADIAAPAVVPAQSEPVAVDTPAPVAGRPDRSVKSGPASRAGSTARARPRDRVTKPRPPAPAVQPQRGSDRSPDAGQASRTEPCSEAVAALGLCNR